MIAAGEAGAQSAVQGVPNAMQGFSQNRDQPIQIEAATLEMRDKKKEATFSGNVKVVQGDTTMTSKTLVVFYEFDQPRRCAARRRAGQREGRRPKSARRCSPRRPVPAAASSIKRLEAKGNVVVTQKDQVVTGETAVFDTKTNLVTMLGGVVLTQGKNVLRGDRLLVDMTTGVSRVESDSGTGAGPVPVVRPGRRPGNPGLRRRAAPPTRRPVPQINRNNINHLCAIRRRCAVEARGASLYLPARPGGAIRASNRGCFAGQGTSVHSCCASESNRRGGLRDHRERLSEAGMVDLLGMFRRRPAKRGRARICALARGHHRARRQHGRHAVEPGARRAADGPRCAADRA